MEKERSAYFKNYINANQESNEGTSSSTSLRVTRQNSTDRLQNVSRKSVNKKRRKVEKSVFVAKLRRANTADYLGIQDPQYCFSEITQDADGPFPVQPCLDTDAPSKMSMQYCQDLLPSLDTGSTIEITTQNDQVSALVQPDLDLDTPCETTTQHDHTPVVHLPSPLETVALSNITTKYCQAPVLLQPTLDTGAPCEINMQHDQASLLTLDTNSTIGMATQHDQVSAFEPTLDLDAPSETITRHDHTSVVLLPPPCETIALSDITTKHCQAPVLLQPILDTGVPFNIKMQHGQAPLPTLDTSSTIEITTHHDQAPILVPVQPTLDTGAPSKMSVPQNLTPVLEQPIFDAFDPNDKTTHNDQAHAVLQDTLGNDAPNEMTMQCVQAPAVFQQSNSRIDFMSREEDIGLCLQPVKSDNEEMNSGYKIDTITITLERERNTGPGTVLEGNNEKFESNKDEPESSRETLEICKEKCTKKKTAGNQNTSKINSRTKEINKNKACTNTKEISEMIKTQNPETSKESIMKYIDFLSDEDPFGASSSSWEGSNETDSSDSSSSDLRKGKIRKKTKKQGKKRSNNTDKTGTRQRKGTEKRLAENEISSNESSIRKKTKRINVSKERSRLKRAGKEYVTKTGKIVAAKSLKENPCTERNCTNKCYTISEEKRKCIFNHYWTLTIERQRDWIISHSKRENIKRKRTKDITSRRQFTHTYFINEGEGQRPVCLNFLVKTLDIRQRNLHKVISDSIEGSSKVDGRGGGVPANKTPSSLLQSVKDFIESLPALPSHYCRKNSKKCYLPQQFRNLTNLYKIYKQENINIGKAFVGEKVFRKVFLTEFNISFHVPRKDKCVKCIKYENSPGEYEEEKNKHLKDKEETYSRFQTHQELRKYDNKVLCTTFDLQKVLNTPYGESMLLYYSRKIAVYNLTFYESVTKEGFCFLWNEVEGKRGANEICTILAKYIQKVDERKIATHLLLYCDSCPGQNRNKTVLACLHKCLQKCQNITTIQINYLLPGHTFMPVDSMHSVIEKSVTNIIVWAPSQWPTICGLARKTSKPYEVEVLTHDEIEGWDATSEKYFKGNLVGKISKIRTATFKKKCPDHIEVKYSMNVEAELENIEVIGKSEVIPKKIYKCKLPISKKKYSDLVKLCDNKTIPAMYIPEYKSLPHATNIQDVFPDTDVEDNEED